MFLDTMNADLAKIDAALGRQDVLAVLQTMHRMRGALVMVKMNSLSAGFEAVEAQLERDSPNESPPGSGQADAGASKVPGPSLTVDAECAVITQPRTI
ncbi:Hpt domain-containing protein [Achromobacter xylosoxidans]